MARKIKIQPIGSLTLDDVGRTITVLVKKRTWDGHHHKFIKRKEERSVVMGIKGPKGMLFIFAKPPYVPDLPGTIVEISAKLYNTRRLVIKSFMEFQDAVCTNSADTVP